MEHTTAMKKSGKAEKAKRQFLKELKESVEESNQASRGEIKLKTLDEAVAFIENRHGGMRVGRAGKQKR